MRNILLLLKIWNDYSEANISFSLFCLFFFAVECILQRLIVSSQWLVIKMLRLLIFEAEGALFSTAVLISRFVKLEKSSLSF